MLFSEFSTKILAYLLSMIYLCIIIDNFTSMVVSEVKRITIKSYVETLLEIKKGDTKYYELTGTDYTGFHNARKRLEDQNVGKFSLGWSEDKKYFMIKRN